MSPQSSGTRTRNRRFHVVPSAFAVHSPGFHRRNSHHNNGSDNCWREFTPAAFATVEAGFEPAWACARTMYSQPAFACRFCRSVKIRPTNHFGETLHGIDVVPTCIRPERRRRGFHRADAAGLQGHRFNHANPVPRIERSFGELGDHVKDAVSESADVENVRVLDRLRCCVRLHVNADELGGRIAGLKDRPLIHCLGASAAESAVVRRIDPGLVVRDIDHQIAHSVAAIQFRQRRRAVGAAARQ